MTSAERAKRWRDRHRNHEAQQCWAYIEVLAGADGGDAVGVAALQQLSAGSLRSLRTALAAAAPPGPSAVRKSRTTRPESASERENKPAAAAIAKGRRRPASARRHTQDGPRRKAAKR